MSIYDHRFGTYPPDKTDDTRALPRLTVEQYNDRTFEVNPRFFVDVHSVRSEVGQWDRSWFFCYRAMSNHSNVRRLIAGIVPFSAIGNSLAVVTPTGVADVRFIACLVANFCSMILDALARWKVSGTNLNFFYIEQLPVLPPSAYSEKELSFVLPRVLELTYTSNAMTSFARDMGYPGNPFGWDVQRRALIRAELDSWFARAYGLTRDELRYILDPADVMGEDYPSETFRVLKKNEIAKYGEYRTARLVLDAWDRMERGELAKP